jgi:hypothetical protein
VVVRVCGCVVVLLVVVIWCLVVLVGMTRLGRTVALLCVVRSRLFVVALLVVTVSSGVIVQRVVVVVVVLLCALWLGVCGCVVVWCVVVWMLLGRSFLVVLGFRVRARLVGCCGLLVVRSVVRSVVLSLWVVVILRIVRDLSRRPLSPLLPGPWFPPLFVLVAFAIGSPCGCGLPRTTVVLRCVLLYVLGRVLLVCRTSLYLRVVVGWWPLFGACRCRPV